MSFLSYKPTRETKSMKNNFQRKLLREELFKAKKALAEHVSKVYEKRNILKSVLPSRLLPSVLVFTSLTLFNTRKNVEATHTKKLENLSKEQELPLFNLHNTVKLFELDICHQNMYKILLHCSKNPVLEKFDQKVMLAEIDRPVLGSPPRTECVK